MAELVPIPLTRRPAFVAAAMILIVTLAAFLRFHTITARGFFFDELWITELSNGYGSDFQRLPANRLLDQPNLLLLDNARPLWQIPTHTTGAIHPPATFMMLRVWRDLFGDSMFALRSCSATWSLITVVLTFAAAAYCFGSVAGLWAALLSAISTGNIDQAQDVRGYTMLEAFILVAAISVARLRGRRSSWSGATLVGVSMLALMFTHYFAAGPCAALSVWAARQLKGKVRWQTLGAIAIAGVIWSIVWLPQVKMQLAFVKDTADTFLLDRTDSPLGSTMLRLLTSLYRTLVADFYSTAWMAIVGGAAVWALIIWRMSERDRSEASSGHPLSWLWAAIIIGGVGELLALDLVRNTMHLEAPKYLLASNPALCVLLGSAACWRRWSPAIGVALLTLALAVTPYPPKPDSRPTTTWLRERGFSAQDVIIYGDWPTVGNAQVGYLVTAKAFPTPSQRMLLAQGPPSKELLAQLPRDVKWFFIGCNAGYDPAAWLPGVRVVAKAPTTVDLWELDPSEVSTTSPAVTR